MSIIEKPLIPHLGIVYILPEDSNKGTVVEITDGTHLRVGDIVAFTSEPDIEVEINNVTHKVVREHDVLGWYFRAPDPIPIPPTE